MTGSKISSRRHGRQKAQSGGEKARSMRGKGLEDGGNGTHLVYVYFPLTTSYLGFMYISRLTATYFGKASMMAFLNCLFCLDTLCDRLRKDVRTSLILSALLMVDGDGNVIGESGWHNAVWWNREPSVAAADGWKNPQEATYRGHCHSTTASVVSLCVFVLLPVSLHKPVSLHRRQSSISWRWALGERESWPLQSLGPSLITRWDWIGLGLTIGASSPPLTYLLLWSYMPLTYSLRVLSRNIGPSQEFQTKDNSDKHKGERTTGEDVHNGRPWLLMA